jgi:cytoskeletal protein RodZ
MSNPAAGAISIFTSVKSEVFVIHITYALIKIITFITKGINNQMNKQKGSAHVVIVTILGVALVGALGFIFWQNFIARNTETNTDNSVKAEKNEKKEEALKTVDTSIHEVSISLKTEADLTKLPNYTPDSFKSYLEEKLRNNKSFDNGETMVTETWKISKISQVNIQGGQVPTDKDGNGYPGGAPAIWILTPAGTWDQETLNGPMCTSKNGGKVYEEFVSECFIDPNSPSPIKNPNGSIASLTN